MNTITLDRATYGTVPNLTQDAANLINTNNKFISEEAVERFISSLLMFLLKQLMVMILLLMH